MGNKDIIYFGITFEKFDILDFTDDFLAGVRSNFFNSGFETQSNRCVQYVGDVEYFFVYNMEKGKQLSWKVNKNGNVFQNSERVNPNSYRVNTYDENGRIFKRHYFDNNHIWLKSEYLTDSLNKPEYILYPFEVDDNEVIVKIHNTPDSSVQTYLYPKESMPEDGDYSVLSYTDKGFLFFNSVPNNRFISKTVIRDNSVNNLGGFEFNLVDFNLSRNLNSTFDITDAEYLDYENGKPYYKVTNEKLNNTSFENESDIEEFDVKVYEKETDDPDAVIEKKGESYKYYGELDENKKRTGYGRTVTDEGITAYEGGYFDDMRNGFGAFYFKNGKINYVGNWYNNRRNGFGVGFRGSDGSSHIGKWNNNSPEGLSARFDKNGNFIFLGNFIDGKKQGKGITVDDDGSFVVSVFKDDEVVSSYKIDELLENL